MKKAPPAGFKSPAGRTEILTWRTSVNGRVAAKTSADQRAIDKSRHLDPKLARTAPLGRGEYLVSGEHGMYIVTVSRAGYACECPAGTNGRRCWHTASVYRARAAVHSVRAARS